VLILWASTEHGCLSASALLHRILPPNNVRIGLHIDDDPAVDSTVGPLADDMSPYLVFHRYDTVYIRHGEDVHDLHDPLTRSLQVFPQHPKRATPGTRGVSASFGRDSGWTTLIAHLICHLPVGRITHFMLSSLRDTDLDSTHLFSSELRHFTHRAMIQVETDIAYTLLTLLLASS
jgi:hypothetical protein